MVDYKYQQATEQLATLYLHVIGKMLIISRMSSPFILIHASMAAAKISSLKCHHLRTLAAVVQSLKVDATEIIFQPPQRDSEAHFHFDIMADAAMATATEDKGRSGYFIFPRYAGMETLNILYTGVHGNCDALLAAVRLQKFWRRPRRRQWDFT